LYSDFSSTPLFVFSYYLFCQFLYYHLSFSSPSLLSLSIIPLLPLLPFLRHFLRFLTFPCLLSAPANSFADTQVLSIDRAGPLTRLPLAAFGPPLQLAGQDLWSLCPYVPVRFLLQPHSQGWDPLMPGRDFRPLANRGYICSHFMHRCPRIQIPASSAIFWHTLHAT
jgi:hypothetical protein